MRSVLTYGDHTTITAIDQIVSYDCDIQIRHFVNPQSIAETARNRWRLPGTARKGGVRDLQFRKTQFSALPAANARPPAGLRSPVPRCRPELPPSGPPTRSDAPRGWFPGARPAAAPARRHRSGRRAVPSRGVAIE